MAADPGQLLHAQGALGGAAQVRGQAAIAPQDGVVLSRWFAPGPGWLHTEYVQIALLSRNRSFHLGVLLLQEASLLLKDPLKAARKAVGYQLRAVQSENCDVKNACWRQSLKTTGGLVLAHVQGCVVYARMQQTPALDKIGVIGPIVALVLVALDAGVDQIVEFVTPSCRARAIVVQSQLAPYGCLGHTAVAA